MDQRTSGEHRQSDSGQIQPQGSEAADDHSWLDAVRKRRRAVLTTAAFVVVVIVAIAVWWVRTGAYVSTDDAFVDARTVSISAQVNAAIVDVPVTDNQLVAAGTVLIRLDDRDYRTQVDAGVAKVNQAQANIADIEAQLGAQQARIDQADKQAAQAQATLTFAREQNERYQRLVKNGSVPVEQAEQYASNFRQTQATLAAAQANAAAVKKQLPVLQAELKQADAQLESARATLEQAKINLSRTVIKAPVAGRVTRLTAAKGDYAAVGQALTMFVPRHVWVTANFKETELTDVRPGAPVEIRVDAYPGRVFQGHVDSIQAGSGPAFSLLPPENATGNYVKIVQRVPVKISFNKPPDVLLGPGMSVVPSVKTG
jgi:membrane fusion protein, multidrug efflux system